MGAVNFSSYDFKINCTTCEFLIVHLCQKQNCTVITTYHNCHKGHFYILLVESFMRKPLHYAISIAWFTQNFPQLPDDLFLPKSISQILNKKLRGNSTFAVSQSCFCSAAPLGCTIYFFETIILQEFKTPIISHKFYEFSIQHSKFHDFFLIILTLHKFFMGPKKTLKKRDT